MFIQLINSYENKNGIQWYYSFCKKINSSNLTQLDLRELLSFLNVQKTQVNIFSEEVADLIKLIMIYTLEAIRCCPNRVDIGFDEKIYSYLDIINTILSAKFQKMNFNSFSKTASVVKVFASFFDSLIDENIYQYFIDKDQYYQITSFVDLNQDTWYHKMVNEINKLIDIENICIRNADVKGSDNAFDNIVILKNKFRIASLYAEKIGILSYKDGESFNNMISSYFSNDYSNDELKKKIKEIINHKDFISNDLIIFSNDDSESVISFINKYLVTEQDSIKIKHECITDINDSVALFAIVYGNYRPPDKFFLADTATSTAHEGYPMIAAGENTGGEFSQREFPSSEFSQGEFSLVMAPSSGQNRINLLTDQVISTQQINSNVVRNSRSNGMIIRENFKTLSSKNNIDYTTANILRYKKFGIPADITNILTKLEIECVKLLRQQHMIKSNNLLFEKLVASLWIDININKQIFTLQTSDINSQIRYFTDSEVIEKYGNILFSNEILFHAIQHIQTNAFFSHLNSIDTERKDSMFNVVYNLESISKLYSVEKKYIDSLTLLNNMMIYGKNRFILTENRAKSFFVGNPEISEENFFSLIIKSIPECNLFSLKKLYISYGLLCRLLEKEIKEHDYNNDILENAMTIFVEFLYQQIEREFNPIMFLKMYELIKNSIIENYDIDTVGKTNCNLLIFCLHILFIKNKQLKDSVQSKLIVLSPLYHAVKQNMIDKTGFFEVIYTKDHNATNDSKHNPDKKDVVIVNYSKVYAHTINNDINRKINLSLELIDNNVHECILNTILGSESYDTLINFLANDATQSINTFLPSDSNVKITKTTNYIFDENISNFKFEGIDLNMFDEVAHDIYNTSISKILEEDDVSNKIDDSFLLLTTMTTENNMSKYNSMCNLIKEKLMNSKSKIQDAINYCKNVAKIIFREKYKCLNYDDFILTLNELKMFFECILLILQNKNTFEHVNYINNYVVNKKTLIILLGNIDPNSAVVEVLLIFTNIIDTLKT